MKQRAVPKRLLTKRKKEIQNFDEGSYKRGWYSVGRWLESVRKKRKPHS